VLIGDPTRSARAAVPRAWQEAVLDLGGRRTAAQILDAILARTGAESWTVAIGNIHGQGELLLAELDRHPAAAAAPRLTPPRRPVPDGPPRVPLPRTGADQTVVLPPVAATGTAPPAGRVPRPRTGEPGGGVR